MTCHVCRARIALSRAMPITSDGQVQNRYGVCLECSRFRIDISRSRAIYTGVDPIGIENQLREDVERAQNECRLMEERLYAPFSEVRREALRRLDVAVKRLADCVLDGIYPSDLQLPPA